MRPVTNKRERPERRKRRVDTDQPLLVFTVEVSRKRLFANGRRVDIMRTTVRPDRQPSRDVRIGRILAIGRSLRMGTMGMG